MQCIAVQRRPRRRRPSAPSHNSLPTPATTPAATDSADLRLAVAIGLPSIAGAAVGSRIATRISPTALSLIFNGGSVLLLPTHFAVQRWRQQHEGQGEQGQGGREQEAQERPRERRREENAEAQEPVALVKHALFGGSAGILSALMGVGGLPVTMSYLTLATDLPHHLVQGTAMASVAPSVLTSALARAGGGHTPLGVAAAVTCGSVVGSQLGAGVALSLSEENLRALYMVSLVLLGGRSFIAAGKNVATLMRASAAASKPK